MKTAIGLLVAAPLLVGAPLAAQRSGGPPHAPNATVLRGPGARIGAVVRDIDASAPERQREQGGAVIENVGRDTPAEKAGLKKGDIVIEFDGERVRSARQLSRLIEETPPDRTVKAAVVRDGRKTEISIAPSADRRIEVAIDGDRIRERLGDLAERLPNFSVELDPEGLGGRGRLGVTVEELTPQLAEYFGADQGVLVAAVAMDSPAARAGLKAGDVITKVDGTTVQSRADLVRALRNSRDDQEVTIGIVRQKKEDTLKATLPPPNRTVRSGRRGPA
jgi:serine protease Do